MAKGFVLSEIAKFDLVEIIAHIGKDNPRAARKTKQEFMEKFRNISEHPYTGHVREGLTDKKVRFYPVYSYMIVYRAEASPVEIARILSGYRDIGGLI